MEIIQAIYGLLLAAGPPLSLGCFVMAGLKLREEGGINFHAGRGFTKWLFWAAIFLTLPGLAAFVNHAGVYVPASLTPSQAPYTSGIENVLNVFVDSYLVGRIVPILAALLLFKALMDHRKDDVPDVICQVQQPTRQGSVTSKHRCHRFCNHFAPLD